MNSEISGPSPRPRPGSIRARIASLSLWIGAALVAAGLLVTASFAALSDFTPIPAYVGAQVAIVTVAGAAIVKPGRETFAGYVLAGTASVLYMVVVYFVNHRHDPAPLDFPWVIWLCHLMIPVIRLVLGRLWGAIYTLLIVGVLLAIGFVIGEVGNTFVSVAFALVILVVAEYVDRLVSRLEAINTAIDMIDKAEHERSR